MSLEDLIILNDKIDKLESQLEKVENILEEVRLYCDDQGSLTLIDEYFKNKYIKNK